MKKLLAVIISFMLLCGCGETEAPENDLKHSGVWLSYSEVNSMLQGDFKTEFDILIKNCKELCVNNLYLHTRAFGDSIYKSEYFPLNKNCEKYDFDILEYVISLCHNNGISVHAWINPYRISTSTVNIDDIDSQSPAYLRLKDENTDNDKNVCFANGIYLNPAESEVRQLILNGVREIIKNYDIDGIHYDDYFYPTKAEEFDNASYTLYKEGCENPLSLSDWRRTNVDLLISGTYNAVKHQNENVVFSVSPAADIDKNYNDLYADVSGWMTGGYIDVIIPQLYFGLQYPDKNFKFDNLLSEWKKLSSANKEVLLYIGLATYKAKPTLAADMPEWQENDDIVARQLEMINGDNTVDGYIYFSYSSLFGADEEFKKQLDSIKEVLK